MIHIKIESKHIFGRPQIVEEVQDNYDVDVDFSLARLSVKENIVSPQSYNKFTGIFRTSFQPARRDEARQELRNNIPMCIIEPYCCIHSV